MIYSPDTCDCSITIDDETGLTIDSLIDGRGTQRNLVRCKLHQNTPLIDLLTTVQTHNSSFNLKFGSKELSAAEATEIITDKESEKMRIRNL